MVKGDMGLRRENNNKYQALIKKGVKNEELLLALLVYYEIETFHWN